MTRLEMVVELRELSARLGRIENALNEEERKADETFRKIMAAVMESDEAQTSSGVSGVPCAADVVWDEEPSVVHSAQHPVSEQHHEADPCPASHDPALVDRCDRCAE